LGIKSFWFIELRGEKLTALFPKDCASYTNATSGTALIRTIYSLELSGTISPTWTRRAGEEIFTVKIMDLPY
jgi:hypothetical protein